MAKKRTYVKNASDPKQVKEANELVKMDEGQTKDDLIFLLKTDPGKRFIWNLLGECGVFKTSFDNSGSVVYFNEGKRHIGLKLLGEITEHFPNALIDMMKNNGEEEDE